MTSRILTGITTTGTPHLGNYVGAIRPAVQASQDQQLDAFYFMADFHALIKCDDPARLQRSRLEIAATWLAAGLDPEHVTFYRQSDIPEIPELSWILTCVTPKGLMNRAHAYKASVDQNVANHEDADAGVTMGLFSYPILMAADILMFNALHVPVGRDQIQHIEMARDIAQRFSHLYGQGKEQFVLPEARVDESVATLPGLDGRKMSKSYHNTIPLFEGGAKALKDAVGRIVTDSRAPGEAKHDAEQSHLYILYQAFARPEAAADFLSELKAGMGWGDAKKALLGLLEENIAPMRERYETLIARPDDIEAILQEGARKARRIATPFLAEIREAVGLGGGLKPAARSKPPKKTAKTARFVSFREADGSFKFRLLSAEGKTLLTSSAFADAQAAGQIIARIRSCSAPEPCLQIDGPHLRWVDEGQAVACLETESETAAQQARQAVLSALQALNSSQ